MDVLNTIYFLIIASILIYSGYDFMLWYKGV
jgi:hypothetical protein